MSSFDLKLVAAVHVDAVVADWGGKRGGFSQTFPVCHP